jgi:epoxyqueuosine reductase
MTYMERRRELREDPTRVLAGARTVIAVAVHYAHRGGASPGGPAESGQGSPGCIAAYARGTDYHVVVGDRLRKACVELTRLYPAVYRYYVDTGPVLERDWGQAAGVGWVGKNTCLIDSRRGSFFFLGVILTTLELEPDPSSEKHCGTCRRCIDACPTGALVAPYELDSRRCISYLTIEHGGEVPRKHAAQMGNLIFGCDICQDVCPFNRRGAERGDPALSPHAENNSPSLVELSELEEASFRERFRRSPVLRAKVEGFLRNVVIALGNDGQRSATEALARLALRRDLERLPVLRETLRRALEADQSASGPMLSPSS